MFKIIDSKEKGNFQKMMESNILEATAGKAVVWLDDSDDEGFWDGVVIITGENGFDEIHYFTAEQNKDNTFKQSVEGSVLCYVFGWDGSEKKRKEVVKLSNKALSKRQ